MYFYNFILRFLSSVPVPYKLHLHHGCVSELCHFVLLYSNVKLIFFIRKNHGSFSRAINEKNNVWKKLKHFLWRFRLSSYWKMCFDIVKKDIYPLIRSLANDMLAWTRDTLCVFYRRFCLQILLTFLAQMFYHTTNRNSNLQFLQKYITPRRIS